LGPGFPEFLHRQPFPFTSHYAFEAGGFVSGDDHEVRIGGPDPLVLLQRQLDQFLAIAVRALTDNPRLFF
jgi:hypothetical protein